MSNFTISAPQQLTFATQHKLLRTISDINAVIDEVSLDFSNCEYIDSAGLGTLLVAQDKLEQKNIKLNITLGTATPPVVSVIAHVASRIATHA